MKAYILLRNNQEYGPYSAKELQALGLQPADLIWIESESKSWELASEIHVLKNFVSTPTMATAKVFEPKLVKPFSAGSSNGIQHLYGRPEGLLETERLEDPASEIEINFYKPSDRRGRPYGQLSGIGTGVFGFVLLLIGLALCTFMVKTMVQGFHNEAPPSTAQEIKEDVSAISTGSYTAKAVAPPVVAPTPITTATDSTLKKAVTQKTVLAATTKKSSANIVSKNEATDKPSSADSIATTISKDDKADEGKDVIKQPAAKMPSLQIAANDYKVGFLGGISNLELTITNPSSQVVDKATVVVEFLKPNGSVVKSQTMVVENISGNGAKTIPVPSNSRGVKVRYHIVNDGD